MERRAVSARSNRVIQGLAQWLASTSVSPNQISVFSAVVALACRSVCCRSTAFGECSSQ